MEQVDRGQPVEELEVGVLAGVGVVGAPDAGEQARQRVDRDRAPGLDRRLGDEHRQRRLAGARRRPSSHRPRPSARRCSRSLARSQRTARGPRHGFVGRAPCRRPAGGRRRRPGTWPGSPRRTPRGRAGGRSARSRHSQGRATSSGVEDPAAAVADPERAGGLQPLARAVNRRRSRPAGGPAHASSAASTSGGPSPAPLLDRRLRRARRSANSGTARGRPADGADRPVAVLGDDQLGDPRSRLRVTRPRRVL